MIGAIVSEVLHIEILSWDKHNPKRDQKTYTWLRLNNNISTDPDLFGLTAEQKFVFIEILCQASKRNSGFLTLNLSHLSHVTGVKADPISGLISHLLRKPIIRVHDRLLPQDVVTTTPTNERTNVTNERKTLVEAPPRRLHFDFESIYKKYPRKLGKAEGIARLKKMILSQEDYNNLSLAVDNYAKNCIEKGTEERFIRHFSTFVGTIDKPAWHEWLEYKFNANGKPKRDFSYLLGEGDVP